ncbi:hypothetical protein HJC23_012314 [Cyclotella cryptica]|uniref:Uncharacterized protein n=1 Tax=Cyclotella cryptica TaxID=29204 RepID=A0ABD3PL74_9STRA
MRYPELKACPTAPSPICIDEFSLTILSSLIPVFDSVAATEKRHFSAFLLSSFTFIMFPPAIAARSKTVPSSATLSALLKTHASPTSNTLIPKKAHKNSSNLSRITSILEAMVVEVRIVCPLAEFMIVLHTPYDASSKASVIRRLSMSEFCVLSTPR